MICSKFASVNIATQFKLTLPLHYSSILSLIFLFFFNFQFSFFFCFRFSNMIYSKFLSKPVNFFAICSISIFHPHLISSSSFYPLLLPSSHLPSPSPLPGLKQTPILPRNCLHQWTWTVIVISVFCVFFFILTCVLYVKWFEVSFTWRIGLLDKLKWVSSPILLALR